MKLTKKTLSLLLSLLLVLGAVGTGFMSASAEVPAVTLAGDANCDGAVDMADCVLIMQSLANPNKYGVNGTDPSHITLQGTINADVDSTIRGITTSDALAIQKYLLGIISSFDIQGTGASVTPPAFDENIGISFSFTDENGNNKVNLASGQGGTIAVNVNIDAGSNPVSALDVQFALTSGIKITDILNSQSAFRGITVSYNPDKLRANYVTLDGDSPMTAQNGKAAFLIDVEVPAGTPDGVYYVDFSSHRKIFRDNTAFNYTVTTTPLEIVVGNIPVEISNYAELKAFADEVNSGNTSACAIITADIDASASDPGKPGYDLSNAWTPIGYDTGCGYKGVFDGCGYRITGLTFDDSSAECAGLFGHVSGVKEGDEIVGGIVKNVGIEDGNITGNKDAGGVAGFNSGLITGCYFKGSVSGNNRVGGIAGCNSDGTIGSCYNTGEVSGEKYVGGVTGYNNGGKVRNCFNTGNISGNNYVGGVTGQNTTDSSITNCYNTGEVSGKKYVGGVTGAISNSTVSNCYTTGNINPGVGASDIGVIVGYCEGINGHTATIKNCYYDSDKITGLPTIGGEYYTVVKSSLTGLTTAQMTGDDALSDSNMKFVFSSPEENPWLTKADGTDEASGEYYWFYPHLKGFAYDTESTAENWPAKTEVTVKVTGGDTLVYDGEAHKVESVIIGDISVPKGATVIYQKYGNDEWADVSSAFPVVPGKYRMTVSSGGKVLETKYFTILEALTDYTVSYCKKVDSAWSTDTVIPVSAGDYKAVVTFTDTGFAKGHAPIEKEFTIDRVDVTVTAASEEFTYDGTAHSNDGYEVTGLVGDDAITAVVTGSIKYPSESPVTNKITSYVFTAGTPGNYNVTTVNGSLTMAGASKSITITSASQAWTYDGQSHSNSSVTVTSGELFAGDVLVAEANGSVTNVSDTAEGNNPVAPGYRIMHGDRDVTANYAITAVNGTLTINPASVTLTANSRNTDVYDGTEKTVTGFKSSVDGLTINGVSASGSGKDYGSYDVTFTGVTIGVTRDTTGNYIVTATENGTLTINKRNVTLTSPDKTYTYDGTDHVIGDDEIIVGGDGWAPGEGVAYSSKTPIRNVGTKPNKFTYTMLEGTNADNYSINKEEGTLEVTDTDTSPEKVVQLAITDSGAVYNLGDTITYTVTVTNIYDAPKTATLTVPDGITLDKTVLENIAPGDSVNTVARYTVTSADIIAGKFETVVTAVLEGKSFTVSQSCQSIAAKNAEISVTAMLSAVNGEAVAPGESVTAEVGDELTFVSKAANNGNVTLTNAIILDSLTGTSYRVGTLKPGEISEDITVRHTVTAADIEAGKIIDSVKVTAENDESEEVSSETEIEVSVRTKYKVIYIVDGEELATMDALFGQSVPQPREPQKDGYKFAWTDEIPETMPAEDITINGKFTAIEYTARFLNEAGETVKEEKFTVESGSITEPDVPEKTGYTGKWSEYTIAAADIQIQPVYTPIEYTAGFVNEAGETIREVKFTVETESLDEPAVPEKTNYTGAWEDYTIGAGDMTIRPVYTLAGETKVDCVNCGDSVKLGYKQTQQYTFSAEYLPEGASVHIFINGEDKGEGTTYKVKEPTESYTVQAKVLDKDGNVITESDLITVKVKNSLCAKIWYFLMKTFSALVGTIGDIVIK